MPGRVVPVTLRLPKTTGTNKKSKMKINSTDIIGQIERLGEAFPWDRVQISINRTPEGAYHFDAYLPSDESRGAGMALSHGATPGECVDRMMESYKQNRDPESTRQAKIAELQKQIKKLRAVIVGPPPYKRGTILTNGEPSIEVKPTIDI
jgi:hypothetical protein